MADSSIEWTDSTWNPVAGCTVITAGCTNCYAMRMAARLAAMGQAKYDGLTRKSGRRCVWIAALMWSPAISSFEGMRPSSISPKNSSGLRT
jgi:protein gp37